MNEQNAIINQARSFALWTGIVLIGLGTVSLFYLAMMVIDMIKAPDETMLIKWIITEVGKSDLIVSGFFSDLPFEMRSSDALQYIALGILGLIMVSILASIANNLISGGISLVTFAGTNNTNEPSAQKNDKTSSVNRLHHTD